MEPISQDDIDAMKERGYDPVTIREGEERLKLYQQGLAIIDDIKDVFAGVTLGNGVGLYESRCKDEYADQENLAKYRALDEKEDWQKIPVSELNNSLGGLCFFDAEGMRFHLPAYLIADLQGEYNFGMSFCLTHLNEHSMTQFTLLSPEQRRVVRAFLTHILNDPDYQFDITEIQHALLSYWNDEDFSANLPTDH